MDGRRYVSEDDYERRFDFSGTEFCKIFEERGLTDEEIGETTRVVDVLKRELGSYAVESGYPTSSCCYTEGPPFYFVSAVRRPDTLCFDYYVARPVGRGTYQGDAFLSPPIRDLSALPSDAGLLLMLKEYGRQDGYRLFLQDGKCMREYEGRGGIRSVFPV